MPEERAVRLDWSGTGTQFVGAGTEPSTPSIAVDGDGSAGPSPMLALLLACGACTGADVVTILRKMRVDLKTLRIAVSGVRRDEAPRRFTVVRFHFTLAGEGLDRRKAERAVALSLEKYCSVLHSLAADIRVDSEIELA